MEKKQVICKYMIIVDLQRRILQKKHLIKEAHETLEVTIPQINAKFDKKINRYRKASNITTKVAFACAGTLVGVLALSKNVNNTQAIVYGTGLGVSFVTGLVGHHFFKKANFLQDYKEAENEMFEKYLSDTTELDGQCKKLQSDQYTQINELYNMIKYNFKNTDLDQVKVLVTDLTKIQDIDNLLKFNTNHYIYQLNKLLTEGSYINSK